MGFEEVIFLAIIAGTWIVTFSYSMRK